MKASPSLNDPIQSLTVGFFQQLPIDIYSMLQHFLSHRDYRRFLSTSPSIFHEIKRKTIYYDLTLSSSLRFIRDDAFRQSLLGRVEQRSRQVSIHLSLDYYDIKSRYFYHYIAGVHTANIKCFRFQSFLSSLQHIAILFLENGVDVTVFPRLAALTRVTLRRFAQLQDITSLAQCEDVQLIACPLVRDVTALADVTSLLFEDCPSITSLTSLGRQQRVTLIRCSGVTSVCPLSSVRYVTVQQCFGVTDFASLSSDVMHSLHLIHCPNIIALPATSRQLQEVRIQNCPQIVDYAALTSSTSLLRVHISNSFITAADVSLSACQTVKLVGCPYLDDVTALADVSKLHLEKCWKLSDVSALGKVVNLTLIDCPMLTSLVGLGRGNHRIVIAQCPNVMDFQPLQAIPDIHLVDCPQPIDVACFSLARSLTLQACPDILYLSRIASLCPCLQVLRLIECRNVNDLHNMWRVPVIVVQHCPNLIDYHTGPSAFYYQSDAEDDESEEGVDRGCIGSEEVGIEVREWREWRVSPKIIYEGSPCIHTVTILHPSS